MEYMRNAYKILVVDKHEGKEPLGNRREIGWEDVDWIGIIVGFWNTVMNLRLS
jgi:hypothetical protein